MCKFDEYLVAWMDRELDAAEAASVQQHLSTCPACRLRIAALESASNAFASNYAASLPAPVLAARSPVRRLVSYISPVAAAIVIALILLPRGGKQALPAAEFATGAPPSAAQASRESLEATTPVPPAVRRRATSRHAPPSAGHYQPQPMVQIVIPADAMFPPGAMPDGFAYVANLNYSIDGAMPGYRLQQ